MISGDVVTDKIMKLKKSSPQKTFNNLIFKISEGGHCFLQGRAWNTFPGNSKLEL